MNLGSDESQVAPRRQVRIDDEMLKAIVHGLEEVAGMIRCADLACASPEVELFLTLSIGRVVGKAYCQINEEIDNLKEILVVPT